MRARALILGAVALTLAACTAKERPLPTAKVTKGPFVRKVLAEGTLKAVKSTPVSAPGSDMSFKVGWLADEGARVAKGDVVVRFDPSESEKALRGGLSERDTAQARAFRERADGGSTVTNLGRDAEQAGRERVAAETWEAKDPELYSRQEIVEATVDAGLAGHREGYYRKNRDIRRDLMKTNLELTGIDARKAKLKIDKAEKERAALEVLAPHDGIVLFKRNWRGELPQVGQNVWSGMSIAELPDTSLLEAEIQVLEADAGGLAKGKRATVVLEGRAGEQAGTVKSVDAVARPRQRGVPVQYFGAILSLEKTDPLAMRLGQRIVATLFLDEEKEALSIPRQALFEKDGKVVAYRKTATGFEAVPVKIGASALGRVLVKEGLTENDVVALRDPASKPENGAKGSQTPDAPVSGAKKGAS